MRCCARANFCTLDNGIVIDRSWKDSYGKDCRACSKLSSIRIPGIEISILPRSHRFALVFRGNGLSPEIADCDPGKEGKPLPNARSLTVAAENTAKIVDEFVSRALSILKNEHPANGILLRGFASVPTIPSMSDVFKLTPLAIATYPMYRVMHLVGMKCGSGG